MSNSLDRNGSGGMRANLDMGNNQINNLVPGVLPTDAATVGQMVSSVPIGGVIDFWGSVAPTDFLFAAGQELSRIDYAALFAIIGTAAGPGNGSTTFNLPDYRGRIGAGRENMALPATTRLNRLSSTTLGSTGGDQEVALTTAQLASHTHTGSTASVGDHTHPTLGTNAASNGLSEVASTYFGGGNSQQSPNNNRYTGGGGAHTHTLTINNTGSGDPHFNVQPTIICNKIIKVQ